MSVVVDQMKKELLPVFGKMSRVWSYYIQQLTNEAYFSCTFLFYILVKLLKKNVILLSQYTHNNKNECVIILHGGLR